MVNKEVKEQVAKILFMFMGGIYPEDFQVAMGIKKPHWDEIPEHERDEYRTQSQKVLEFLDYNGHLR